MRHLIACTLVALLTLTTISCGGVNPNTVPPGSSVESQTTALYAYKGLRAVEVLQRTVIDLEASHSIKEDQALAVMNGARKAGVSGGKLADALEAYDRLKALGQATTGNTAELKALISEFESAVNAIAGLKIDGSALNAIATFVGDALAAVRELKTKFSGSASLVPLVAVEG